MPPRVTLPDLFVRPLIMGIVNVTPDSFSGDGLLNHEAVFAHAAQMIENGAALLDIGGESSRPGARPVGVEEEIRRTAPLLKALRAAFPATPLSIDTTKPAVARAALEAGACILNDISGFAADPAMVRLAAEYESYLVLTHNRAGAVQADSRLGGAYEAPVYNDIVAEVRQDLQTMTAQAQKAGIGPDRLILDPGLGFGKTVAQNLRLINEADKLSPEGLPLLLGPSRKSFIGHVLDLPPEDRLEGTAAAITVAILRGAAILRVHDVKAMSRTARMTTALARGWDESRQRDY